MNTFKDPYGILTIIAAKEFAEEREVSKIGFLFNVQVDMNDFHFNSIKILQSEFKNLQLPEN